jgi:O-antigen/teichoic acid export membrane protein
MADLPYLRAWKRLLPGAAKASPSEKDRGRQRLHRINLTIIASVGFRGAMWLSGLIYVPLTVQYLGPGRFGLWVAMISVMTLLAFSDCGIGYGLINHVVYATGGRKADSIRASISSTFAVLVILAVAGCLLFAAVYPFIPWSTLLRTATGRETREAAQAIAVIVVTFLLTLPFTTVQRVQTALQRGYETQLWEIAGVLLSFFGLLIAIHLKAGLPALAIIFAVGPLIALVLNWLVYFCFREPSYLPAFRFVDVRLASEIVREGGYFLILQVSAVLVFSTDTFIVLRYFGQAELGEYTLVAKLFQVTPALASVWFAALWPAYSESIARGDHGWVRHILFRSVLVSGIGCAAVSFGIACFVRPVVLLWTGTHVNPSIWLLAGFILFSCLAVCAGAVGAFLNSVKFIRRQAIVMGCHALVSIALKIVLCKYWDVSGAVWGASLAYLLVVVPAYWMVIPNLVRDHTAGRKVKANVP